MHDLTAAPHHRRDSPPKSKEMKPLLTHKPLSHDRVKKPPSQPQKARKRPVPTTPAYTFDPRTNLIPSGKQNPPISPPVLPSPPASESPIRPYDGQQTTSLVDRQIHDQLCSAYPAQKRPCIPAECFAVEHSASSYPDTPCTDANDMSSVPHNFHDSPVSHTSSSSPDLSDQSSYGAEFAVHGIDYTRQAPPMFSYGGQPYVQSPVVHPDPYGYPMGLDRPAQGYPVQYPGAAYGRPGSHSTPENSGYPYPPFK